MLEGATELGTGLFTLPSIVAFRTIGQMDAVNPLFSEMKDITFQNLVLVFSGNYLTTNAAYIPNNSEPGRLLRQDKIREGMC